MKSFLTRYQDDPSRPTAREVARDVGIRLISPGIVLFGLITGLGLLLVGPSAGLGREEERANRWIAAQRSSPWNSVTYVWSQMANTLGIIALCLVVVGVLWWRTRQWWYAVIPLLAISLQALVFVSAAGIVGRQRPPVPKLDTSPPTASFPSGHTAASTALYTSFLLMATRIENATVRYAVMLLCAAVPLMVAYSRFYRGMHHITDILGGAMIGISAALLSWNYLRRSPRRTGEGTRS